MAEGQAKDRLRFVTRQFVDAMAPSNFVATNPEFVQKALETKGESITQGIKNLIADLEKGRISMTDDSAFEVGRNLAITPGAVVFENELMQLIQYSPLTDKVAKRPLRDGAALHQQVLHPRPAAGELLRPLRRGAGPYGVPGFVAQRRRRSRAISTWDDYIEQGLLTALHAWRRRSARSTQVNALGFCVGGTIICFGAGGGEGARRRPVSHR